MNETQATNIHLYNTMSQQLELLQPKTPQEVRLYVCGPTVYDVPHAGHARSAVAFDVLVRHLKASGLDVTYARNITDIDDKILKRSAENGEAPLELSARMAEVYQQDIGALGCLPPTHQPRVSQHLDDIVSLVQRLIANDAAYVAETGGLKDVYFSVRSFEDYGKLSRRNIDDLEVGARVEENQTKKDPLDFALWKGVKEDDWGWDSPWGRGRPGWHIECSAMSSRYLGHGFDIHGGGMDLIFPHHENEIAQSEAAHPGEGPFANLWMHNGFVNVDKEKMSKSLGNFVTIRDVLERNDPEGFRYFLLTVQYRGPLTFDTVQREDGRVVFPGVDEGERRVDYLFSTWERLEQLAAQPTDKPDDKHPKDLNDIRKLIRGARDKVTRALDDDVNTPVALAAIAELAKAANDLCDMAKKRRKDKRFVSHASELAAQARDALRSGTDVLGLLQTDAETYAQRTRERRLKIRGLNVADIDAKVAQRTQARKDKDFAKGDELRNELQALDIELLDTPEGTVWRVGV